MKDIEKVQGLSTRLLEVVLREFPGEQPDVVLVGLIDTAIKCAKVTGISNTTVQACELLLLTITNICIAECANVGTH